MSKIYMIGEKNGLKYVAHTDSRPLDNATEITKAEYRRHRSAGVPSWGEQLTATEKENARNPKRAAHWAMRKAKAKADAQRMEYERMRNWQARRAHCLSWARGGGAFQGTPAFFWFLRLAKL